MVVGFEAQHIEAVFAGGGFRKHWVQRELSDEAGELFGVSYGRGAPKLSPGPGHHQGFWHWRPCSGHERVPEDLVGRGGIPSLAVAGVVYVPLAHLAGEAPFVGHRRRRAPQPLVEILLRSQLHRAVAQSCRLGDQCGDPSPRREGRAQVGVDVRSRDAVELGEQAGFTRRKCGS